MKKLLVLILITTLLITSVVLSVNAYSVPNGCIISEEEGVDKSSLAGNVYGYIGDVDKSDSVNIRDVTSIQKYIASIYNITDECLMLADANLSGSVNIQDVTVIQKWLVSIPVDAPVYHLLAKRGTAADNSSIDCYYGGGLNGTYKTFSIFDNTVYNEWVIENVEIVKKDYIQGKFSATVTLSIRIVDQREGCPNNIRAEYLFVRDGKYTSGGGTFSKTNCIEGELYQITFTEYGLSEGDYMLTFSGYVS